MFLQVFGSARYTHVQYPRTTRLAIRGPRASSTKLNRMTNVSVYLFLRCRYSFFNHFAGYSAVTAKSLDFHGHSHELAHNLGAGHNIEDALDPTGSAHGKRRCGKNA